MMLKRLTATLVDGREFRVEVLNGGTVAEMSRTLRAVVERATGVSHGPESFLHASHPERFDASRRED